MDLFNQFENKSHEGTEELKSYEIRGKKGSKLLFNFIPYCTFKHGDKTTNLIKARILEQYEKGHTIVPDSAKYVCFEISTDINLSELANDNVFSVLEQVGELKNLEEKKYNHIGIIDKVSDGKYELFSPTIEVLEYVHNEMDKEINENNKLFTQRINRETRQQFVKRISDSANEHIKIQEEIREERKKNPILEEQFRYKIADVIYQDYKGISLTDGKILKINRLNRIYDEPGNVLYSAFIQKIETEEEQEAITLQAIPKGFPILFILKQELENMIQNGKQEKVLELLSDIPDDILNVNEIQYIGGLDSNGNINIDIEGYSNEIKEQIKKQKESYKKQKEEQLEMV